jgi:hypothetical protein
MLIVLNQLICGNFAPVTKSSFSEEVLYIYSQIITNFYLKTSRSLQYNDRKSMNCS